MGEHSRPRVLHVTTAHSADDVRIFERECRSLAASDSYDVYLAASGAIPADSGVTLIPLAPPPASRAGRFAGGPRKALGLSRALSVDLWHFHDPELLPVALKLARSGHNVIWDAHEDYVAQFTDDGGKSWVPGPARRLVRSGTASLLAAVDRHAAGIVAATPTIAGRYHNLRTVVVGNEARLELFANCQPSFEAGRVLFTGSPGPGHLFDQVVEAVSKVPGARLVVAGREPDSFTWIRAREVLGERLVHLGWLDRSGIAGAISASSLGLSTYADIPTNAENSPNKLFEFAAAGLPVVASPTQSNQRLLNSSCAGFAAEDFGAEALSEAIARALSDREAWEAASSAGRVWAAREGSWSGSEARLFSLYDDVLGHRRPSGPVEESR